MITRIRVSGFIPGLVVVVVIEVSLFFFFFFSLSPERDSIHCLLFLFLPNLRPRPSFLSNISASVFGSSVLSQARITGTA